MFSLQATFPAVLFFHPSKSYSFIFTRLFDNFKARIPKSLEMWQQTPKLKRAIVK